MKENRNKSSKEREDGVRCSNTGHILLQADLSSKKDVRDVYCYLGAGHCVGDVSNVYSM